MADLKLLKFPRPIPLAQRMVHEIEMKQIEMAQLDEILWAIEMYLLDIDDESGFQVNSAIRIAEARFWLNSLEE
jgi:hypothetical protein